MEWPTSTSGIRIWVGARDVDELRRLDWVGTELAAAGPPKLREPTGGRFS